MTRTTRAALALLALLAAPAGAGEIPPEVHRALSALIPGIQADQVRGTPVEGLYEVTLGSRVFYLSADGKYLLRGDVVDVDAGRNLTEERRREARRALVDRIPEESMIVFAPADAKYVVTVFTDVDCPYCARLHQQMDEYHALGVAVRYLAFPRAGIPSPSYDKTVSVWCSADPHTAIGDAKAGRPVPKAECDNPVRAHFLTGQELGVTGTPTIVLESGEMIPGYVPPRQLVRYLTGDTG